MIEHNGRKLELKVGVYRDLSPAVYLLTEAGSIYVTLTVTPPDSVGLGLDEFIVKSWEVEGLWEKVKHEFVNTGRMCNVGGIPTTPIYRLRKPKPIFVVIRNGTYWRSFWTREEAQRCIMTSPALYQAMSIIEDYIQ